MLLRHYRIKDNININFYVNTLLSQSSRGFTSVSYLSKMGTTQWRAYALRMQAVASVNVTFKNNVG